ncbi:MAG TPA: prolyl oligopeptidase family serine peptidase [Woeseiaceae bacterium]|nr:prolyl oligopeptidase family serine peptidase [Woeseiaceae bacterium]
MHHSLTRFRTLAFSAAILIAPLAFGQSPPPLEAYGAMPTVDLLVISPSGNRIAYRLTTNDQDVVVVADLQTMEIKNGLTVGDISVRQLRLVDDDTLIIHAGRTARALGFRGQFDFSTALRFDVSTGSLDQLLWRADDLHPAQSGLGQIIGAADGGKSLLMPAFHSKDVALSDPRYGVYSVDLETNRARLIENGSFSAVDWFADDSGQINVRVDFIESEDRYRIWSLSGKRKKIFELITSIPPHGPVGMLSGDDALVYAARTDGSDFPTFYRMDIDDGEISGLILERSDSGFESVLTDLNRTVHGFQYTGFTPTYTFFDEELNARVRDIVAQMDGTSGTIVSWSKDFEDIIVRISGVWNSGAYVRYRAGSDKPELIVNVRPGIAMDQVVPTKAISYAAQDGLEIPALVTAHDDLRSSGNAPLVVLPHGGPAAYDSLEFDWIAQYFASRGYVVLQPQFRGSSGFGSDFMQAGFGEWGGKMQTDIDDGVDHLIDSGLVNADRVCIVGASYGGYAALAAGAFSPEKYRCVASIAGISDLERMLKSDRRKYGRDHWAISYWERQYGGEDFDWDELDAISPINFADRFQAPVLLIHGKKDTVVPIDQSRVMRKALRKAGKDVELIEYKGEDHWLSYSASRMAALRALARFVEGNL